MKFNNILVVITAAAMLMASNPARALELEELEPDAAQPAQMQIATGGQCSWAWGPENGGRCIIMGICFVDGQPHHWNYQFTLSRQDCMRQVAQYCVQQLLLCSGLPVR